MPGDVYYNYQFVGTVPNPKEFAEQIVSERRKSAISRNINVKYDASTNSVNVENSTGRARKPVIIVRDGQSLLTENHIKQLEKGEIFWKDLVDQGVIEYLDASEEENAFIAFREEDLTPEHTHLEISPVGMFSLCSSLVPFANFSPGARASMGSKNQKQAIGFYAANFSVRMDMDVNLLHYPQAPILRSMTQEFSEYDKHPSGQNIIVAVMSYKGYNMDDSIIVNRGSIELGLGRSTFYRPAIAEELRYSGGLVDEVCIPEKDVKGYRTEKDYKFLEDDGIVYPEAVIKEGQVIIGKTSPPRFLSSMDEYNLTSNTRRESSITVRHGEGGIVDVVIITENEEGNKLVQVKVRDQRIPEIGDKFTSRHGQKGVIGLLVDHADMPFSATGTVPDLIFSPHGIPSRMTISHLIELVGSKAGALSGRNIDGTTFDGEKEVDLRKELHSLGFRENGVEALYNGETGEILNARIYIGNMYYLKLKHMVANKIHGRARGPIQLLTRQPTEGRAKEGGLRLGEMEKDTFIAHGASMLLKERFDADKTIVPVCEGCGMIAIEDHYKKRLYCPTCGDNAKIGKIEVAYAFKLILDEFKSLCIYPKMKLKNKY